MRNRLSILLLLGCIGLLIGTFYLLLRDRFDSGDVYPPSSSLRSDPLGTMILFESLQTLPGVTVNRDFSVGNRLPVGQGTTYLHFASQSRQWTKIPVDLYRTIDRFLLEGGRLVITLAPEYAEDPPPSKIATKKKPSDKDDEETKEKTSVHHDDGLVDLEEKWALKFTRKHVPRPENRPRNTSDHTFAPEIKWNGDLTLKDTDGSWLIIYEGKHGPVLAERKRGPGTIVIATDTYFTSNEALVNDRHPALLAWLIGPSDHVIFDEAHLGIRESSGIAALARKYRLHAAALALLVLAGLFIWKNSASLAPAQTTAAAKPATIVGRAAGSGFISLLQRNIPRDRILGVCLEEWLGAFRHSPRFSTAEKAAVADLVRAEDLKPVRERDPLTVYQKICTALRRHV